jgi:glutathione synthase
LLESELKRSANLRIRRRRPEARIVVDVIDAHLTEINVTSPTGIRAIARLDGPDVAAKIWDVIEKKRG